MKTIAMPIALIVLIISVLAYMEISIPLESVRQKFITRASELAGHDVKIEGEVRLAINFYPTLVVDRLSIASNPGWTDKDIFTVGTARAQLALLPILSGRLEFIDITFDTVHINLEQSRDGTKNWSFLMPAYKQENLADSEAVQTTDNPPGPKGPAPQVDLWIEEIDVTNLHVRYRDRQLKRDFDNKIDRLTINTVNKDFLAASINGIANDIPYEFSARSDLLRRLVIGEPWKIELDGKIARSTASLHLDIESIHENLHGKLEFKSNKINFGKLLSWLGIAESLDASSDDFSIKADLAGNNLSEILDHSDFMVELENGYWNLHDPVDDDFMKLDFKKLALNSKRNSPVTLSLDGHIGEHPAEISMSTNQLNDFFSKTEKIHIDTLAKLSGSTVKAVGDIRLPLSAKSFAVDMDIKGDRLDQWNNLIRQQLPPYGPYNLSGQMQMTANGFLLSDVMVRIGESKLRGSASINTSGNNGIWELDLHSERLQVNDFDISGHSLFSRVSANHEPAATSSQIKHQDKRLQLEKLKSTEVGGNLQRIPAFKADITLSVEQLLSGNDYVGSGNLQLLLSEKALSIETLELKLPGGNIKGAMSAAAVDNRVKGHLKLDIHRFNYGLIYRHLNPESPANGLISLKTDLSLDGKDLENMLEHANGNIDFAIWPKDIDATALNFWSINLLLAILPELRKKESTLNCGVAVLDLNQGQLSEQFIFIDSTNVWMRGNLNVSFPEETVSLALFPTSKKARIFGLEAPLRIRGSFDELGAHVKPFDIISAYISFITSPLHVPFRRLFGANTPTDASEFCGQAIDRDYLRKLKKEIEATQPSWDDVYE